MKEDLDWKTNDNPNKIVDATVSFAASKVKYHLYLHHPRAVARRPLGKNSVNNLIRIHYG